MRMSELSESRPRVLRRDEVALALVACERLLERLGGFLGTLGERQYLGEVGVGVALRVDESQSPERAVVLFANARGGA